jgi:hypothetical protein
MVDEGTPDGQRLIDRWLQAVERVKRIEAELERAKVDAGETMAAVAKWMQPEDVKDGEKICVWQGDDLFQVERVCAGVNIVTVRKRGNHFGDRLIHRNP